MWVSGPNIIRGLITTNIINLGAYRASLSLLTVASKTIHIFSVDFCTTKRGHIEYDFYLKLAPDHKLNHFCGHLIPGHWVFYLSLRTQPIGWCCLDPRLHLIFYLILIELCLPP